MGKILQSDKMKDMKSKLVRDNIPSIITKDNKTPIISSAKGRKLLSFLKSKLVEEATEVRDANSPEELIEELADVLQVILSISQQLDLDFSLIEDKMIAKAEQRGEFKKGYILEDIK